MSRSRTTQLEGHDITNVVWPLCCRCEPRPCGVVWRGKHGERPVSTAWRARTRTRIPVAPLAKGRTGGVLASLPGPRRGSNELYDAAPPYVAAATTTRRRASPCVRGLGRVSTAHLSHPPPLNSNWGKRIDGAATCRGSVGHARVFVLAAVECSLRHHVRSSWRHHQRGRINGKLKSSANNIQRKRNGLRGKLPRHT